MRAGVGVVRAVRDLARLVVPVECAGCGERDVVLCTVCASALLGPVLRCEAAAPRWDRMTAEPAPIWAAAPYVGPVRGIVVAWKDRGRGDLTRPLRVALAGAVAEAVGHADLDVDQADVRGVVVVPVPSWLTAPMLVEMAAPTCNTPGPLNDKCEFVDSATMLPLTVKSLFASTVPIVVVP